MKWKIYRKPELGDTRLKWCYAWWPIEVDGYKIWLESYYKRQVFRNYKSGSDWITTEKFL